MFQNALVSVSDKTGLVEFLRPLVLAGLRVVSTGGTLKHLRDHDIYAVDVSEQTGFKEVMDGRVKTLHPKIHMALLARSGNAEDLALLKQEMVAPFDLVVVNLYPFESALRKNLPENELIEFIDIGGPSMLRSAAKSHERIAVVCEPSDYGWILEKAKQATGLSASDRRMLAARVFAHTSRYDDLIAKTLSEPQALPSTLVGQQVAELRYGENPQQKAWWYRLNDAPTGLHDAQVLHGKPLSFNNLMDLEAAVRTVREFEEASAVAVKHNSPCGVGTHSSLSGAIERALKADPVSVFGGIVALNRTVDLAGAEQMAQIFLECIVAPEFTSDALERLKKKKDLRILSWPEMLVARSERDFRTVSGGFLVQTSDAVSGWSTSWKVIGEEPSNEIRSDLALAWKVVAHLKSNAIAIVQGGCTIGLGMGQVNRIDAVEQALARAQKHHPRILSDKSAGSLAGSRQAVLASDAFFPFPDSVELAAQAGVRWVIQPGGSIRDAEVLSRAKDLGVTIVLTGQRHFRH